MLSNYVSNHESYTKRFEYLKRIFFVDVDHKIGFQFDPSVLTDATIDQIESRFGDSNGRINIFDTFAQDETNDFVRMKRLAVTSCDSSNNHLSPSINCLQWYPVDTGLFVSATKDKCIKLWDSRYLKIVDTIKFDANVTWLSMSDCSRSHNLIAASLGIFSDGSNRAVLIDPLIGSATINILGGHTGSGLTQVNWSPSNSNLLITGGHDGRVLFWDIRYPKNYLYSLNKIVHPDSSHSLAHAGPILGLTFSPDGMHLVTWGGNHSDLSVWSSGPLEHQCQSDSGVQPTIRPINFSAQSSNTLTESGTSVNSKFSTSVIPIRIAVASDFLNDVWGASSFYIFVPSANRLLIAHASKRFAQSKYVTRHFSKIRSCVWNKSLLHLYTCGMDGNLFCWTTYQNVDENDEIQ